MLRVGVFLLFPGLLALRILAEPSPSQESQPPPRLRVVTSILPICCFARSVAGDAVQIDNLLASGADAHDFQFSPRERRLIDRAELILVNGLGLEPWLGSALTRAGTPGRVVAVTAGLAIQPGPGSSGTNAHVWLDPLLARHMVTNILRALQTADPGRGALYARNASDLVEGLNRLHADLDAGLRRCRGAAVVTTHDAFLHFARRYGLRIVGVIEEVPDVEPTPGHLSRLRRVIQAENVKVIFCEPYHSVRLAGQLGKDLNLAVDTLDTLESGTCVPGAYEAGMRRNLAVLLRHLP